MPPLASLHPAALGGVSRTGLLLATVAFLLCPQCKGLLLESYQS